LEQASAQLWVTKVAMPELVLLSEQPLEQQPALSLETHSRLKRSAQHHSMKQSNAKSVRSKRRKASLLSCAPYVRIPDIKLARNQWEQPHGTDIAHHQLLWNRQRLPANGLDYRSVALILRALHPCR
jgi:hypothetical protein